MRLKSCVHNSFYTVSRIDFKLLQMIWYDVKMCVKLFFHARLFEAELLPFDVKILCAQLLLHLKSDLLETFKDYSVSCEDVHKALIFPARFLKRSYCPFTLKSCVRNLSLFFIARTILKQSYCHLMLKSFVRNSFTVCRIDLILSQIVRFDVNMCIIFDLQSFANPNQIINFLWSLELPHPLLLSLGKM